MNLNIVPKGENIFCLKYDKLNQELNLQLKEAKEKVKKIYDRWDELERKKAELHFRHNISSDSDCKNNY